MAGANLVAAMGYGSVRGCDAQCGDGGAQRGEPSVVVPIGRGAPAQPDTEDLDAAIVADGPYGCSGIATAARRHTGGQVLVIAVGCGDAAALLAGGDSGSADGVAGPRPCVIPGGCSAADDGQRYCAGPRSRPGRNRRRRCGAGRRCWRRMSL